MPDVNVGVMLSTTLKNYRKTLTDNVFGSNAVFYALKRNGAVKEEVGGERIVEPILYGENTTAGSYSGYDTLDYTPQEGIDSAEFTWKQYYATIIISGAELRKNKGSKYRIIDLLDAKTKQAELSIVKYLTSGLFSDGTGNGGKDLTGFTAMINNSGTYGGINSSTYTWWRANMDTTSEALSLSKMRTAFNSASVGGKDVPDLITTTQTLFEKYENFFTQVAIGGTANLYTNFQTPSEAMKKVADGGFQALAFKGVPIVWDDAHTSGVMYFLNTKHFKLVVHEDANLSVEDFRWREAQDAYASRILFMGNLTCNRRKSFSGLTNKS